MRRKSLLERIRLFGRSAIDVLAVLGRSWLFLLHALIGRGGIGGSFQLLIKQLYSVGVLSLAIIVVSGIFIGMVLSLQFCRELDALGLAATQCWAGKQLQGRVRETRTSAENRRCGGLTNPHAEGACVSLHLAKQT